jgi:hypothetical protein
MSTKDQQDEAGYFLEAECDHRRHMRDSGCIDGAEQARLEAMCCDESDSLTPYTASPHGRSILGTMMDAD